MRPNRQKKNFLLKQEEYFHSSPTKGSIQIPTTILLSALMGANKIPGKFRMYSQVNKK